MTREDGWMPIETAPRDGSKVLLYKPARPSFRKDGEPYPESIETGQWGARSGCWYMEGWLATPSHWMPLPAPPESAS